MAKFERFGVLLGANIDLVANKAGPMKRGRGKVEIEIAKACDMKKPHCRTVQKWMEGHVPSDAKLRMLTKYFANTGVVDAESVRSMLIAAGTY